MFLDFLFGDKITQKVEKKKSIEGEIEVLKKQQKVSSEKICKEFKDEEEAFLSNCDAQILALNAQIIAIKRSKLTQSSLMAEQKKVMLDKTINEFNCKITSKQNKAKRLGYLIDAEQKNMKDLIQPDQPNAPQILLESDIDLERNKLSSKKSK